MRFRTREGRAASLGYGLWAESPVRADAAITNRPRQAPRERVATAEALRCLIRRNPLAVYSLPSQKALADRPLPRHASTRADHFASVVMPTIMGTHDHAARTGLMQRIQHAPASTQVEEKEGVRSWARCSPST